MSAEVTLPGDDNSSVPAARHFVLDVLADWGRTDEGWTASLVVTELAANAALHAGSGPFTVTVSADGSGVLRIAVTDGSPRAPRERTYSAEATTGRGLKLVADLASRWGVTRQPSGKVVWADIEPVRDTGPGDDDADVDALLDAFADLEDAVPGCPGDRAARDEYLARAA